MGQSACACVTQKVGLGLVFDELEKAQHSSGHGKKKKEKKDGKEPSRLTSTRLGGFLPAVQQIANVATLPGIVG